MDMSRLTKAAEELNKASDELGVEIGKIDAKLAELHLGVSAWVVLSEKFDENGFISWRKSIGYAKVGAHWGISLMSEEWEGAKRIEHRWPFNQGPRYLRMDGITSITELVTALEKRAQEMTEKAIKRKEELVDLLKALMPDRSW